MNYNHHHHRHVMHINKSQLLTGTHMTSTLLSRLIESYYLLLSGTQYNVYNEFFLDFICELL